MPTADVSFDDDECRVRFDATGMDERSIRRFVCLILNDIQEVKRVGSHIECVTAEPPEVIFDNVTMEVVAVTKLQRVVIKYSNVPEKTEPTVTIEGESSARTERVRSIVEDWLRDS